MKHRLAFIATAVVLALTAACTSTPNYPEPAADSGQILVELHGEPRDGVTGPRTERDRTAYDSTGLSVEQGKAFERVNYGSMDDVVVIVKGAGRNPGAPRANTVEIGRDGFSRAQLLIDAGGELTMRNRRDQTLNIFGYSGDEFIELSLAAGATASVKVPKPGAYVIDCEEDPEITCTLYVLGDDAGWIGSSREGAFFDSLAPGEYSVFVHGPRLPCWYGKAKVNAGARETLNAGLTVNRMTKLYGE